MLCSQKGYIEQIRTYSSVSILKKSPYFQFVTESRQLQLHSCSFRFLADAIAFSPVVDRGAGLSARAPDGRPQLQQGPEGSVHTRVSSLLTMFLHVKHLSSGCMAGG